MGDGPKQKLSVKLYDVLHQDHQPEVVCRVTIMKYTEKLSIVVCPGILLLVIRFCNACEQAIGVQVHPGVVTLIVNELLTLMEALSFMSTEPPILAVSLSSIVKSHTGWRAQMKYFVKTTENGLQKLQTAKRSDVFFPKDQTIL